MRRYSLTVSLHILAVAVLSALCLWLALEGLWFCTLTCALAGLAVAFRLYRLQMTQIRMLRHMVQSLQHDDTMLAFRPPYRNRALEEMAGELSRAMQSFRNRVWEQHEMEAWQKLISVLTHEIMNSLAPIISLSETLSGRKMEEKDHAVIRQGMRTINRRSKDLLEFVENYRRLTRLPAPVRQPVSVSELLTGLRELYPEDYIHIEIPATDKILCIDRTQIEQVIINLIKNASQACGNAETPRIEVSVQTSFAWQCLISVRDNGCGIMPEVQDKIFVPFFSTRPSGSGIGLSLCKQIMNRHGGKIAVQSVPGQGSCFTLYFGR